MINGKFEIAPSILSADFSRLAEEIKSVESAGVKTLHIDVMDGHFVPNITIGLPVVESIRKATNLRLDAHLMINEPGRYAVEFVKAGADMVSVHIEADKHLNRTLSAIREAGALAGVAINPATSLSALDEAVAMADFILLMCVNPGFGGQKFVQGSLEKLRRLKAKINERGLSTVIEIDGGISKDNIREVVDAGAQIIVAGSAVFKNQNRAQAINEMIERTYLTV
jgi:ribulose-phosphate 3-epimerase